MLILFLSIVFSVLMMAIKMPLIYIAGYLVYICAFYFILKKRKNENIYFYLIATTIIGLGFYSLFLSPSSLAATIAEEMTKNEYGDHIYRSISYNAVDIDFKGGNKYYIVVAINAGKFYIRNFYQTVYLPTYQIIISYMFLAILVLLFLFCVFQIFFEKKNVVKTDEYNRFVKEERKKRFLLQIISIMIINVIILFLFTREMYTIYGAASNTDDIGNYIGLTSLYEIMIGKNINTNTGTIKLPINVLLLFTYLFLIASIVLTVLGKNEILKKEKKSFIYIIISGGLFLLASIGLIFTNKIAEITFNNKSIADMNYIYVSNNTNIFEIYRIASSIIILLFYVFLVYKTFKKEIKNKKS